TGLGVELRAPLRAFRRRRVRDGAFDEDVVLEEPPQHLGLRLLVAAERDADGFVIPDAARTAVDAPSALQALDESDKVLTVLRELANPVRSARGGRNHDPVARRERPLDELDDRL